jgi:hypothetical protein
MDDHQPASKRPSAEQKPDAEDWFSVSALVPERRFGVF